VAVLELLPPGIRPHSKDDDAGPAIVAVDTSLAMPVIERFEKPSPEEEDPDWLEVEYTIDPDLDERVRGVLAEHQVRLGHVILMDPASGEIFSYVSTDPETFPATRAYPTASLMKVVTAAAVLRKEPAAVERDCRYVGNPYQLRKSALVPPRRGGRVDPFWRTLALSNNQCFARLAVHDVGEDLLIAEMRRVGLLDPPAALHPEGLVEPISDDLDLGNLGSGLAGSFVTPLGAARLAAVLAGGELVQPFWIARVRDDLGNLLEVPGRRAPNAVWLPQVADELRELMVEVTERGTAKSAFRDRRGRPLLGSIRVAGKTGSLSGTNPDGHYHWFIGVAPAEAPRIAIASVLVNEPPRRSSASAVAAATLREVFCGNESCEASRIDGLLARASARNAEYREAAAAARAAAAAAAIAAEKRREEELARVYEIADLDRAPRVLSDTQFDFPERLLARRARGKIILSVDLSREGDVVDAWIDSSNLSRFNDFILGEVEQWKFTPPTRHGNPVNARTHVPLNIRIQ
jgi:membrane peptidoglycan carboxypeptidase